MSLETNLIFYHDLLENALVQNFCRLDGKEGAKACTAIQAQLSDFALSTDTIQHYAPELWKDAILKSILHSRNALNHLFEREILTAAHPLYQTLVDEFRQLLNVYHFDWEGFCSKNALGSARLFSTHCFSIGEAQQTLYTAFEANRPEQALVALNTYIHQKGFGIFEACQSFKISRKGRLIPINAQCYKGMDTLVGYDLQKQEILKNTEAFIAGQGHLNVLLQGDMGTGKSTMVKALLHTFSDTRLKMIEIKKSQIETIPAVIETIKNRPYPFILFIDDLSFEEHDEDYKTFKNVLEGSLEENPKNIAIYATSNKRHLITETMAERTNAVHKKDVMEEKLSLSSRFGLVLTFEAPNKKNYLSIVAALAKSAGCTLPEEELEARALTWELRHLNRSGRTAEQFIDYLKINGLC